MRPNLVTPLFLSAIIERTARFQCCAAGFPPRRRTIFAFMESSHGGEPASLRRLERRSRVKVQLLPGARIILLGRLPMVPTPHPHMPAASNSRPQPAGSAAAVQMLAPHAVRALHTDQGHIAPDL